MSDKISFIGDGSEWAEVAADIFAQRGKDVQVLTASLEQMYGFRDFASVMYPLFVVSRPFAFNTARAEVISLAMRLKIPFTNAVHPSADVGCELPQASILVLSGSCVGNDCLVAAGSAIGEGAVLRSGTRIGKYCHVGQYAEVAGSILEKNVIISDGKRMSKSYIGSYSIIDGEIICSAQKIPRSTWNYRELNAISTVFG